jgi:signal transduction histidine kinase/CheY-like chemotaxis protein
MIEAIDGLSDQIDQPILRSLVSHDLSVPASLTVEEAYESLRHHSEKIVAVTVGARLIGAISRAHIIQLLSGRFGFALYSRASLLTHLSPDCLCVVEGTPILDVLQMTLSRSGDAFLQDVALADTAGNYLGVITFETLVRLQAGIVRRQINEAKQGRELLSLQNVELQAAKDAAENANRIKGDFLANMSHEVRTPMHGIIGLTQLALEGELPAAERELILKASESAASLLGILNDILDLTKIEAGKLRIEKLPFDLDRSLELVKSLFGQLAAEKDIQFDIVRSPEVPRGLLGDALRMRQILNNLLSNALKFTKKGMVTLTVRVESTSSDGRSTELQFEVKDTGIGISPDQQMRIFHPFEQADTSTTRRFGGTGLGLAISRHLVDMMGGRIELESSAGEGSLFRVSLPFGISTQMIAGPGTSERAPRVNLNGVRVLLVEDNRINVLLATKLLEREGVRLTVAENGQVALDLLDARPDDFDLVLMDIQMPVLDGHEATRILRRNSRFSTLPVIAMTADAMSDDRQACLDAGMQDYLPKPVNADLLFATIDRWRGRRRLSPETNMPLESEFSKNESLSPASAVAKLALSAEFPEAPAALERLNEDADLYWMVVSEFVASQPTIVGALRGALLEAGDIREARRAAHTLKGLASTMGATVLYQRCQRLDSSLQALQLPAEAAFLLGEVEVALAAVLRRIEMVLGCIHGIR